MSDQSEPTAPDEEPPPKSVLTFFKENNIPPACPRCGFEHWWRMNAAQKESFQEAVGVHSVQVQTIACQRCGLIERYLDAIVSGKVKSPHER